MSPFLWIVYGVIGIIFGALFVNMIGEVKHVVTLETLGAGILVAAFWPLVIAMLAFMVLVAVLLLTADRYAPNWMKREYNVGDIVLWRRK